MMRTLSELEQEIESMLSICYKAEVYYKDNIYLLNPDTIEERVVVENDNFIKRARYAMGIMSIIELNKLFGKGNDHFSLKQFLNKLLQNYHNAEWRDLISIEIIKNWQANLSEKELTTPINKLNTLRNQYYAHSDRNPNNFESFILEVNEMEVLFEFCHEILYKISVDVLKTFRYSIVSDTEKASGILKRLTSFVVSKQ